MTTSIEPSPGAIARQTLKALAAKRVAPTPENYAKFYAQAANVALADVQPTRSVIETIARELRADPLRAHIAHEIAEALAKSDWTKVKQAAKQLCARLPAAAAVASTSSAAVATADEPTVAATGPAPDPIPAPPTDPADIALLKELFTRALTYLVDERLGYPSDSVSEARSLAMTVQGASSVAELEAATSKLRQLWIRLETRGEGPDALLRGLHGLLLLLLRNLSDLAADDRWAIEHIEQAHLLLTSTLSAKVIGETERNFKAFAYRQGALRASIDEAKAAVRDMMAQFLDQLGVATERTGVFSEYLGEYSQAIRQASDLHELSGVLERLVADTLKMQGEFTQAHGRLDDTRKSVEEYELRVRALEAELEEVSGLVREDPLTQALNRRGINQQYLVEEARAKRKGTPLALAMIDLDNFKRLNDSLGHQAGDAALKHVAEVIRQVIRPTDTLGRYGGEEFLVLLPETALEPAGKAIARVQAELARRTLQWEGTEVVLTFSCGIAERRADESQTSLIERADAALYRAKQAGKNCIIPAE